MKANVLEGDDQEEISLNSHNFLINQKESWHSAVFPASKHTRLILIDLEIRENMW